MKRKQWAVRTMASEYGHVAGCEIPTPVQPQKGCNKPDFSKETSEKADNKQLYQSVFRLQHFCHFKDLDAISKLNDA